MRATVGLVVLALGAVGTSLRAQDPGMQVPNDAQKQGGSPSMHMLAHVDGYAGAWKAATSPWSRTGTGRTSTCAAS